MRVMILGACNSRTSGGIFNSARFLGESLTSYQNADVQFLMYDDEFSVEDKVLYEPMPIHSYTRRWPMKLGYSSDIGKIMEGIKPDLIHSQGIWMYFSRASLKYSMKHRTPYVISPHGMLDPWQLRQSFIKDLKKRVALALYESKHLKNANCIHALCMDEYKSIRTFGLNNPVAIIPNGTSLPASDGFDHLYSNPPNWFRKRKRKTLLFLGRLHHKKGLDNLITAWSLTNPDSHGWQLVIAGETKDDRYVQALSNKVGALDLRSSVSFIGGQFGKDKEACFLGADAFILPSFSEGLPMAVLEAWSYRLPVIMTSFCNLPEGFDNEAAVRIDTSPDSIASGIRTLFSYTDDQLRIIGENGFRLVQDKFTWERVAEATMGLYNWILGVGDRPAFVYD